MIKISLFYPNNKSSRFDMTYYVTKHMPASIEKLSLGKSFRGVSVKRGLGGESPESDPAYVAMCHFLFDSAEDFLAAFNQHAAFLQGDMPNYTDITPTIQFSAVEISK